MAPLRWTALGIGIGTAVCCTLVAAAAAWGWLSAVAAGAVAVGIGGVAAAVAWAGVSSLEAERRRLIDRLEDTAAADATPGRRRPAMKPLRYGLQDVAVAVDHAAERADSRAASYAWQRRELEVQLRIREADIRHLKAVLNTIADAVVVTDAFNEVALANASAARVLGFDLNSASRSPVDRVIGDQTIAKLIKDTREGGGAALRKSVEHPIRVNGQTSTYQVTMACILPSPTAKTAGPVNGNGHGHGDSHGHGHSHGHDKGRGGGAGRPGCAGVVTILRDVTREKEIAEMKSDFVSNVSHELRTPLSSIKAYVEMLIDGEATDEQTRAEFYNIIQGETNRLNRLIDNILNISRIESGVVKVQREHVSLPQLVKEAVDIMLPQARAKRIGLTLEPSPLYFQVFADRDMLLQSVLNYVGNAVKYTPEGGRVTVSLDVDEHDKEVRLSVADTGLGVPAEDLPHLFDKFYRVNDHKKAAKGTGLGLNLVKHVIETVHGGRVGVTSKVGEGSTFTFTLPIADNG